MIQPTYRFLRNHLASILPEMSPRDLVPDNPGSIWCLVEPGRNYLVYAADGGRFRLDLRRAGGSFAARWFDPRSGSLAAARGGAVSAGGLVGFQAPDNRDWVLWLEQDSIK